MEKINKKIRSILEYIKDNAEVNLYILEDKFADAQRYIGKLLELGYIIRDSTQDPNEINGILMFIYSISDNGLNYLEDYKEEKFLSTKEKWEERLWGFFPDWH